MVLSFSGTALPFDTVGLAEASERLGVSAAEVWSVLAVETCGCGFLRDCRPFVLFERHIFHREPAGVYDEAAPDISHPRPGGYGAQGARQYDRLRKAMTFNATAALRSASWGIAQIMGFNADIAGFADVESMVTAMAASENEQLRGMATLMLHNNLHRALRSHDWPTFARGYNGPDYARNRYDVRLAAAYQTYQAGALPDLDVRAAQVYLIRLGYDPGRVDGRFGRFTRSALNDFQRREGLPLTEEVDDEVVAVLRAKATSGPDLVMAAIAPPAVHSGGGETVS